MRKFSFSLIILVCSTVSVFPQFNEILKRMDAHQKALKSLQAEIAIEKSAARTTEKSTKTGTVKFLPGKTGYALRLDSATPAAESLVILGNRYELFLADPAPLLLPAAGTVYTGAVTESQRDLFFIFSILANFSKEKLKSEYGIIYTGDDKVDGTIPAWHLEFRARNAKTTRKIEVWINGDGMPIQTRIGAEKGDSITVTLTKSQKNVRVGTDDFKLNLPANVKTVANRFSQNPVKK